MACRKTSAGKRTVPFWQKPITNFFISDNSAKKLKENVTDSSIYFTPTGKETVTGPDEKETNANPLIKRTASADQEKESLLKIVEADDETDDLDEKELDVQSKSSDQSSSSNAKREENEEELTESGSETAESETTECEMSKFVLQPVKDPFTPESEVMEKSMKTKFSSKKDSKKKATKRPILRVKLGMKFVRRRKSYSIFHPKQSTSDVENDCESNS